MTQTLGVVYIFVPCEAAEHGLTQHADHRTATVLAGPRIGQYVASR